MHGKSRHARLLLGWKIVALVIVLFLAVGFFANEFYAYGSKEDLPYMTWGSGRVFVSGRPGETIALFHTNPVQIDPKSKLLESDYFKVDFIAFGNRSFTALLLFSPADSAYRPGSPRTVNGSLDLETPIREASWELDRRPHTGLEPWTWHLNHAGEYPWDEYSLEFVFGFNETLGLVGVASDVYLPQILRSQWKVSQSFREVDSLSEALRPLGFSQQDIQNQVRSAYHNFYKLKIAFLRQWNDDFNKSLLSSWFIAMVIGVSLVILSVRIGSLGTVSLGLLVLVPVLFTAAQALPAEAHPVPAILYLEMAGAVAVAVWKAKRPEPAKEEHRGRASEQDRKVSIPQGYSVVGDGMSECEYCHAPVDFGPPPSGYYFLNKGPCQYGDSKETTRTCEKCGRENKRYWDTYHPLITFGRVGQS